MYLQILIDTFSVTGPIFVLVLAGLILRRSGFIDDHFVSVSSKLVFSLCLPTLLFITIIEIDPQEAINPRLLGFALIASVVTFALGWLAALLTHPVKDRGVVIQGAARSNLGVIGLALCANAYGAEGLGLASILMAVLTVSYNVLSVFALTYYGTSAFNGRQILKEIVTNPLILAIGAALMITLSTIPVPQFIKSSGSYLGQLALPLALIGTGAAMNLKTLRESGRATVIVTLMKSLILPAIVTIAAISFGFVATDIGILFLLFVSPTATASYVMVTAMGGNDELAANLIMVTTIATIITASLGLFLLQIYGFA